MEKTLRYDMAQHFLQVKLCHPLGIWGIVDYSYYNHINPSGFEMPDGSLGSRGC